MTIIQNEQNNDKDIPPCSITIFYFFQFFFFLTHARDKNETKLPQG